MLTHTHTHTYMTMTGKTFLLSKDFSSSSNSSFASSCIFLFHPLFFPPFVCLCAFISRFTTFMQKCSQYSAYACKQINMNCSSQNLYLRSTLTLGIFVCIAKKMMERNWKGAHTHTHSGNIHKIKVRRCWNVFRLLQHRKNKKTRGKNKASGLLLMILFFLLLQKDKKQRWKKMMDKISTICTLYNVHTYFTLKMCDRVSQ